MRSISASEAKQAFGAALEAAQREPLMIQKQNRDVAVLLSAAEYDELPGLGIKSFERLCDDIAANAAARGLPDDLFEILIQTSDQPGAA